MSCARSCLHFPTAIESPAAAATVMDGSINARLIRRPPSNSRRPVPDGPHRGVSSNPRNQDSSTKGGGNWQRPQHAESIIRSPHPTHCSGVAMTATSRAPRRPRIRPRGPPPAPTPIRTARGARSAAADDRVLAEFLETSLRVPNLTLPPQNRKGFQFPPPPPELPGVAAQALVSGSESSTAALISAAAKSGGAFTVSGVVGAGEVREAVEASEALFAAPEQVKRGLGRWFRNSDRVEGEEFCWFRPVSPDDDRGLEAALPGSVYRQFREKMDTVASKMEDVAKTVIRVLSHNVKNGNGFTLSSDASSILRLTLNNGKKSKAFWNDSGTMGPPSSSHTLSIHLSGNNSQIRLRNQSGSALFSLPAGSMLITVGKQIQEWSNGEFKSAEGEILVEKTDEPDRFMTLELLYSPEGQRLSNVSRHARCIDRPKIVAFGDQILVALVLLSLFYLFWN